MNKFQKLLLQNLLKAPGNALNQREFLDTFPERDRNSVIEAISKLQVDGFVMQDYSDGGITITLPASKINDAMRSITLIKFEDDSYLPVEEMIPKKYSSPFLLKEGEKLIHGKVSTYAFCYNKKDPHDITCFIVNSKGSVHSIHLGSVYDPSSKISMFLKEIDKRYKNVLFTREDLKNNLPKKLIQNNQPTKAAIEYLCYEKFLIRFDYVNDWSKFGRTGKPHPVTTIDEIVALHETKPSKMSFMGGSYAYTEEDGLYPVLY